MTDLPGCDDYLAGLNEGDSSLLRANHLITLGEIPVIERIDSRFDAYGNPPSSR